MRSRAVASGILIAIVLGLAWGRLGPTPASANRPHPGLDFSIAVSGAPNCDTKSGDATCDLAPGSSFVIEASLQPLPSDIPSYKGFDIVLGYSGVTPVLQPSTDSWPDCAFAAVAPPIVGLVAFGCATGIPPAGPSTYTGVIGTASFSCDQSGTVSLIHGEGHHTDLVEDSALIHAEDPQTTETLTINCVEGGVTAIAPTEPLARATSTPRATQLPATERAQATATAKANATAVAKATSTSGQAAGGGGGGLSAGVIAIIVIAAVAVAGGAGFFGWRYLQSRRGSGGAT